MHHLNLSWVNSKLLFNYYDTFLAIMSWLFILIYYFPYKPFWLFTSLISPRQKWLTVTHLLAYTTILHNWYLHLNTNTQSWNAIVYFTSMKGFIVLGPCSQYFIFFSTYEWAQKARALHYAILNGFPVTIL